ncbi:MAG: STAS domain-containing protein [Tissierellia bacterium]|nr:STAS domain-containing protein [Tissierellia bacterium]
MFQEKIREEENKVVLDLKGDLDIYSLDQVKEITSKIISYNKDIVADLKELDYIDSTGLGQFINIYKAQKENNKSIKIINAKPNIKKLFAITDLKDIFNME